MNTENKVKCPMCLDYEIELITAGIETRHLTKDSVCCVGCLEYAFRDDRASFYPNGFLTICRELKCKGELTYDNLNRKLS